MVYTIDEIRQIITPIAKKYGLPAVYLFGSYARGTANEDSDVDLIIDTEGTQLKTLLKLGELYNEFEGALGKQVDLITVSSLQQRPQVPSDEVFRDTVWKERVNIYDAA